MFFLPYHYLSLILLIPMLKKITKIPKIQLVLPLGAFLHQQFLIYTNSLVFSKFLIFKSIKVVRNQKSEAIKFYFRRISFAPGYR